MTKLIKATRLLVVALAFTAFAGALPAFARIPSNIAGAIDSSGVIDIFDFAAFKTDWGRSGPGIPGDINRDNSVNIFDFAQFVFEFGRKEIDPAKLYLAPASQQVALNQTFTVDVNVDTGGANIHTAQAILNYDKTRLAYVGFSDLHVKDVWASASTSINYTPVEVSSSLIIVQMTDADAPLVGRNIGVVRLTFRTLSPGSASVGFVWPPPPSGIEMDRSLVLAGVSNATENILGVVTNGVYAVQ